MKTVLFICTGNIFRSMSAEHCLRHHLRGHGGILVCSAGTDPTPRDVHPRLIAHLAGKGIDVRGHCQTVLTRSVLAGADLAMAMGRDHQEWVRRHLQREIPLFKKVCLGCDEPILDIWEKYPDWEVDMERAFRYLTGGVDEIYGATAELAGKLRAGEV